MNLASKIESDAGEPKELKLIFSSDKDSVSGPKDLVLDRDAIGRIRRELIWTLGENRMHGVLARVGYSCGQSDFIQDNYSSAFLDSFNIDLRKIAPSNLPNKEFMFEVHNSFEANEHLRFFPKPIKDPQCYLLAGYLTGAVSCQTNQPTYFLEIQCISQGDPTCRFLGKSTKEWKEDNELAFSAFNEDNMSLELAETREMLKTTKDRYQNLFEQASVPILITDSDTGVYLDVNMAAAELSGYSREELLKMNVFDLRPPEEHHEAANYLKTITGPASTPTHEMTLIRKDGELRKISVSGKTLSYGGQKVVQTVFRDITDLKESEQKEKDLHHQLLRSERLSSIGRLAAGVAHELKNPLGAIQNAIYYIKSALVDQPILEEDPDLKDILKLAESELHGSVRIIEELLDFSRVVDLIPRHTQVNDLLESIPTLVKIPEKIKLEMDLDMSLPSAMVDPDRLKQVFSNLVSNAVQAMHNGGTLTIRSRLEVEISGEDNEKIELVSVSIEDTGSGIDALYLKKIFEPLFTTKARGTGLGLAISGNIIEKHGGVIQVTSKIKKGTTFTVKLPIKIRKSMKERNNE